MPATAGNARCHDLVPVIAVRLVHPLDFVERARYGMPPFHTRTVVREAAIGRRLAALRAVDLDGSLAIGLLALAVRGRDGLGRRYRLADLDGRVIVPSDPLPFLSCHSEVLLGAVIRSGRGHAGLSGCGKERATAVRTCDRSRLASRSATWTRVGGVEGAGLHGAASSAFDAESGVSAAHGALPSQTRGSSACVS